MQLNHSINHVDKRESTLEIFDIENKIFSLLHSAKKGNTYM